MHIESTYFAFDVLNNLKDERYCTSSNFKGP